MFTWSHANQMIKLQRQLPWSFFDKWVISKFHKVLDKTFPHRYIPSNFWNLRIVTLRAPLRVTSEDLASSLYSLSAFSFTDTDDPGEERGPFLFLSTTSARSRTFTHLFATLHVRWLRSIHIACNYQTATRWDLPPYWITTWLIDDEVNFCLFTWQFSARFFITGNWHGKPVDLNSHRLSPLYYKRTE